MLWKHLLYNDLWHQNHVLWELSHKTEKNDWTCFVHKVPYLLLQWWLKRFGCWGHSANVSRLEGNQTITTDLLFLIDMVLKKTYFFLFLHLLKGWDKGLNTHRDHWRTSEAAVPTVRSWVLCGWESQAFPAVGARPSLQYGTQTQTRVVPPQPGHFKKQQILLLKMLLF